MASAPNSLEGCCLAQWKHLNKQVCFQGRSRGLSPASSSAWPQFIMGCGRGVHVSCGAPERRAGLCCKSRIPFAPRAGEVSLPAMMPLPQGAAARAGELVVPKVPVLTPLLFRNLTSKVERSRSCNDTIQERSKSRQRSAPATKAKVQAACGSRFLCANVLI